MSVNFSPAIVRRGIFHSLRFEIAAILSIGVALPVAAFAMVEGKLSANHNGAWTWLIQPEALAWASQPAIINSLVGVVLCAFVSLAILRRLRFFPGVAVARSILPVIAVVFGIFIAVITSFRLEYSNKLILSCFFSILVVRFAITAVRSRAKGVIYYLVPGGQVNLVSELRSAPVFKLERPSLVGLPDCAVVADLYADLEPEWERFLAEAAISGRPIYHYKQVWEAETGRVQIEHLSENGFGALVPSFAYQKVKRGVDLVLSIFALPIVVPIIALCSLAIKWDSRGPVFFRQRRMGFRGKEFFVLKLRTMTEGHAGDDRNLSITQSGDKRITRVGGFLRRTRLDEVPQIFNILRGEMSWIGPRPEAVSLSHWYEGQIPFYRYRHIVRPGISGWAQVNQGHVADVHGVGEKLQYDFYYIKNLSYWLDVIIALRTVKVMISGFGSK
ncbi:sugar transferase [Qipengyuania sp. 902]|uniref:sugar transferase n=1 Tax=Qipengyuania sp. 902 TaxID=3417565 RepID=UPI003EB869BF